MHDYLTLNHPALKVAEIDINLRLLLQGINNLNLVVVLGFQTMKNVSLGLDAFYLNKYDDENLKELQRLKNEITINGALAAAFSSSLIYAHAMCETILMDICNLIKLVDCNAWVKQISDKKVSLSEISEKSLEEVKDTLIIDFLEILERKSLLEKVDKLLGVLHPNSLDDIVPGFKYSREVLKDIDDLRHKCTHEPNWIEPLGTLEEAEEKAKYLADLGQMLLNLVVQKYNIPDVSEFPKVEN